MYFKSKTPEQAPKAESLTPNHEASILDYPHLHADLEDIQGLVPGGTDPYCATAVAENHKVKGMSMGQVKRAKKHLGGQLVELGNQVTSLVCDRVIIANDPDNQDELLKELMAKYLPPPPSAAHKELVADNMGLTINTKVNLRAATNGAIEKINDTFMGDPKESYTLMRLLSKTPTELDAEDASTEQAQLTFSLQFAAAYDSFYSTNTVNKLERMLADGEFDEPIAARLLQEAYGFTDDAVGNEELNNAINLIALAQNSSAEQAMEFLASSQALALWPSRAVDQFNETKLEHAQNLKSSIYRHRSVIQENFLGVQNVSDEYLQDASVKWRSGVAGKQNPNGRKNPNKRQKQQQVVYRGGKMMLQTTIVMEAEAEQQPERELVLVDKRGNVTTESDDQYQAKLEDLISQHSSEKMFIQDMERVFDYLRKLDLSQGILRGVKKLQTFTSDVYELKPQEATGLTTKTALSKRMRIIFMHDQNKIGLVDIVHRSQLDNFQRVNSDINLNGTLTTA